MDPRAQNVLLTIAARVRQIRRERGFTQAEIAARADLAPGTLSRLESGREPPTVSSLVRLADALGVSLGDLVGDASLPPSAPATPVNRQLRQLTELAGRLDRSALRHLLAMARLLATRPPP